MIELWYIGKNKHRFVEEGIAYYEKKIIHYTKFDIKEFSKIKISKNASPIEQQKVEAEHILSKLSDKAMLVVLDEKGKEFTSKGFSQWLEKIISHHQHQLFSW